MAFRGAQVELFGFPSSLRNPNKGKINAINNNNV